MGGEGSADREAHGSGGLKWWQWGLIGLIGAAIVGTMIDPDEKTPSVAVEKPDPAARIAALGMWYRDIDMAGQRCGHAASGLGDALEALGNGSVSRYDAYGQASRAKDICQEAWLRVGDIKPPAGLSGKGKVAAKDARDSCKLAYFVRVTAVESVLKVLDGDMRPSAVQTMHDEIGQMSPAMSSCISKIMMTADAEGLDTTELAKLIAAGAPGS